MCSLTTARLTLLALLPCMATSTLAASEANPTEEWEGFILIAAEDGQTPPSFTQERATSTAEELLPLPSREVTILQGRIQELEDALDELRQAYASLQAREEAAVHHASSLEEALTLAHQRNKELTASARPRTRKGPSKPPKRREKATQQI